MHETFKKILTYVIIGLLMLYGCFSTVNWVRNGIQLRRTEQSLELCRTELGQLREELARATNKQLIITERLNRCSELSQRTGELLGSSISTVEGLRTTLREIRKNEEDLAKELLYLRRYLNTDDNNTNNNTGEQ
jgi:hypothetical protein